ncbi:hypothetical protein INR49_000792 [Caranx melampygus]|nr:hypothetical protein INR49_000792 [Caranx melampygus]
MEQCKLWVLVLLPLSLCIDTEEFIVKTTRENQDVTPVCTPAALHLITLIVCKISTKSSRGRECRLLYEHERRFESGCDSRFTLRTETQAVFLHLTGLTPQDSGNYSCECSHIHGTDYLHLSITVEGDEDSSMSPVRKLTAMIVICTSAAFIIISGVVLGLLIKKYHCRAAGSFGLSTCDAPCSLGKDDQDSSYMSLQQPDSDVYQNILSTPHRHGAETKENAMSQASASTRCETPWHLDQDDVYASLQHPDTDVYHTFHPSRPYLHTQEDPDSNLEDGREKDLHEFAVYETIQT